MRDVPDIVEQLRKEEKYDSNHLENDHLPKENTKKSSGGMG